MESTCLTIAALVAAAAAMPVAQAQVWGAEIVLLESPGVPSNVGLSNGGTWVTPDGVVHAVWMEQDAEREGDLRHQIYAAEVLGEIVTQPPRVIVPYLESYPGRPDTGAKWPALAGDGVGGLHLVWHDYRVDGIQNVEIYTKARPAGEAWDAAPEADLRLTTTDHPQTKGDNGYLPTLRRAPSGELRVAWFDFRFDGDNAEIMSKARPAGGEWDTRAGDAADERLTENGGNSEYPDLVFGSDGAAHVVFSDNDSGIYRVYHSWLAVGGGAWSAPEAISPEGVVARAPALAAGEGGAVLCAWEDGREGAARIYTALLDGPGGEWGDAVPVSPAGVAAAGPALAAIPGGTLLIAWSDRRLGFFDDVVWCQASADGSWDGSGARDERVSTGLRATAPELHGAWDGRVVALWRDRGADAAGDVWMRVRSAPMTRVTSTPPLRRTRVAFGAPRPNPFNPRVVLPLELSVAGLVRVGIYDLSGRRVRRLWSGRRAAGTHHLLWDGRDDSGRASPSGSYFARLESSGQEAEAQCMLILLK